MPTKPLTQCKHPGCPGYSSGKGYCHEHTKQRTQAYDDARGNAYQRGYDRAWSSIRAQKMRTSPLCEQCRMLGLYVNADEVHHIDSNPRNNSWDNLQSLCRPCHTKTRG